MPISTREDMIRKWVVASLYLGRELKQFEAAKIALGEIEKQRDAQREKVKELRHAVEAHLLGAEYNTLDSNEALGSNMTDFAERILHAKFCLKAYDSRVAQFQSEFKEAFECKVEAENDFRKAEEEMEAYVSTAKPSPMVPSGFSYWDSRAKAWSYRAFMNAGTTQGGKSVVTPTPPPVTPSSAPRMLSDDNKTFVRGKYKQYSLSEVVRMKHRIEYLHRILNDPDRNMDIRDRTAIEQAIRGKTAAPKETVPKEPKTTTKDRFLSDDMKFIKGKHAGEGLKYIHERYVRWLLRNFALDKADMEAFAEFLENFGEDRADYDDEMPH